MKNRKIIAAILMLIALVLGVNFYLQLDFPKGLEPYLKTSYYSQFGPIAISMELLFAGFYLFTKHSQTNFTMALFGFTAVLDPIFDLVGILDSSVPLYGTIIFLVCAVVALWLAFSNTFDLGRISFKAAFASFLMGTAVELVFNAL